MRSILARTISLNAVALETYTGFWGGKKFRDACKVCHEFVDNVVQKALHPPRNSEARSSDKGPYIFIEALFEKTTDPKVLRDQCINILLAGRDTTACCLNWALRLLVLHPKVMAKLRSEIKETFGVGRQASEPVIGQPKQLSYLKAVLHEVLRLYPSVPVNSRAAAKTTTLPTGGGPDGKAPVLVRKGEAVGYCAYAMHRQKEYFGDDADEFRPERWENGALKDVGWAYLPFNGGPRVCLGQEFALLEVRYTIVKLVQTFEIIELAKGKMSDVAVGQEKQGLTLVVSSGDGCWVKMARYLD
ncbi:cytochrome P450 alkane hydroxylase [Penicillium malachiteum]|uniref:cytochrome P450 alkane hydroxylase n=1 Tax=Penicillium malachiteum TaxID=1324776 RepID=UPI0025485D7D|nr:cytochrome P450 alkane hydroxylase [Penicillium malachiteum]KAJ5715294.1 cytochrome P450 alkane hydroxylase [Penicillium malachiteum]